MNGTTTHGIQTGPMKLWYTTDFILWFVFTFKITVKFLGCTLSYSKDLDLKEEIGKFNCINGTIRSTFLNKMNKGNIFIF